MTGLSVAQGRFQVRPDYHDDGEKTILGKTARFDGDSLADHLLAQPAVADRLAWRLCATFLGEGVADDTARGELAELLRRDDLHIGRAVETILRSSSSFPSGTCTPASPTRSDSSSARCGPLERFDPPPSTLLLAEWTGRMGQELFYPPNVGGWPGGRSWLSGRAVVARANFAAALAAGRLNSDATPADLRGLAAEPSSAVTEPLEAVPASSASSSPAGAQTERAVRSLSATAETASGSDVRADQPLGCPALGPSRVPIRLTLRSDSHQIV